MFCSACCFGYRRCHFSFILLSPSFRAFPEHSLHRHAVHSGRHVICAHCRRQHRRDFATALGMRVVALESCVVITHDRTGTAITAQEQRNKRRVPQTWVASRWAPRNLFPPPGRVDFSAQGRIAAVGHPTRAQRLGAHSRSRRAGTPRSTSCISHFLQRSISCCFRGTVYQNVLSRFLCKLLRFVSAMP